MMLSVREYTFACKQMAGGRWNLWIRTHARVRTVRGLSERATHGFCHQVPPPSYASCSCDLRRVCTLPPFLGSLSNAPSDRCQPPRTSAGDKHVQVRVRQQQFREQATFTADAAAPRGGAAAMPSQEPTRAVQPAHLPESRQSRDTALQGVVVWHASTLHEVSLRYTRTWCTWPPIATSPRPPRH